jgi:4-hydroxy-3-polyprenylbenzoate decarboxylase
VGISGATRIVLGARTPKPLRKADVETHPVVTRHDQQTRALETELSAGDLRRLAEVSYAPRDMGAAIAGGSFRTMGMIVAVAIPRWGEDE